MLIQTPCLYTPNTLTHTQTKAKNLSHMVTIAQVGRRYPTSLTGSRGGADVVIVFSSARIAEPVNLDASDSTSRWHKQLAEGLHGVTTTLVCPYTVDTAMFAGCAISDTLMFPFTEPLLWHWEMIFLTGAAGRSCATQFLPWSRSTPSNSPWKPS